jgi:hypothetical protein
MESNFCCREGSVVVILHFDSRRRGFPTTDGLYKAPEHSLDQIKSQIAKSAYQGISTGFLRAFVFSGLIREVCWRRQLAQIMAFCITCFSSQKVSKTTIRRVTRPSYALRYPNEAIQGKSGGFPSSEGPVWVLSECVTKCL